MGLRVPEDMAVIGCDNQFFCPYADPSLTTVELYPEDMAQSAIRELLFASKDNGNPSFAMMREASLIVRESWDIGSWGNGLREINTLRTNHRIVS